ILAKIVKPFIGKHRMFSHSLLGMAIFGLLLHYLLIWVNTFVLVDMHIVWWAVMIGFGSHLIADALTKQGIPLFFPLPWEFGIPPIELLRMKTGGFTEKYIVFPGLIILNGVLIYQNYAVYLDFFKKFFE